MIKKKSIRLPALSGTLSALGYTIAVSEKNCTNRERNNIKNHEDTLFSAYCCFFLQVQWSFPVAFLAIFMEISYLHIYSSPSHIQQLATELEEENDAFCHFLKNQDSSTIDRLVSKLNTLAEEAIDCTSCGNCCRTLMINVTAEEANRLSEHLAISRNDFDTTYLEKGEGSRMIMNTIPCSFLTENTCSVYDHRFEGCREFPGLHLPFFTKRLFTTFMHVARCPIIFTVVEQLKNELEFHR